MGGAQPLAAVMAGACCLAIECNPDSIDFRLRTRYVDAKAETLDEALAMIDRWTKAGEAKSVGLLGNAAEILPELVRRGVRPDIVTDQTSAHDRREMAMAARMGAVFTGIGEPDYPRYLRHADNPPPLVAIKGDAAVF
ncbi:hypothetical protein NZA98_11435, partial [Escherichia coli]|nr:hypothetical protein [Escherichia coli]